MATLSQLAVALKNADAAGDVEAATKLARAYRTAKQQAESTANLPPAQSPLESFTSAFATDILPAVATGAGGILGGLAGTAGGPAGIIAGDIAGGMAAGTGARMAQEAVMGEEAVQQNRLQQEANRIANPWSTEAGAFIAMVPSFLGGGLAKGLTKGVERSLTRSEHFLTASVTGARLGASTGGQALATGQSGTEGVAEGAQFMLDNMARSAVSLGVTGLIPGAKTLLGAVLGKAPSDAAAMTVANAIYGKAVHGEEVDVTKIIKDTGSHLPAFMIMNAVTHGAAVMKRARVVNGEGHFLRDEKGVWNRVNVPKANGEPVLEVINEWREPQLIERLEADWQAKAPKEEIEKPVNEVIPEAPRVVEEVSPAEPPSEVTPAKVEVAGRPPAVPVEATETPAATEAAPKIAEPVEPPAAPVTPEPAAVVPPEAPKAPETPPAAVLPPAQPSATSIKNRIVDKERVDRGLPPLMEPAEKQTQQQWWDSAMRKVDQDPLAGTKLVEEITTKPRTVSPEENALMLHEALSRENTFDRAVEEVNNATDANRAEKVAALDAARLKYDEADAAGKLAGTEWGRGGVARQTMINRDFSLAAMEKRIRAEANDGKPLSPNKQAWVEKLYNDLKAQNKITEAIDAMDAETVVKHYIEQETKSVRAELEATKAELAEAEKKAAQKPKEPKPEVLKKVVERLQAAEDKAWANIKSKAGQVNFGFDPTLLADYAVIVASWTAKGVKGVTDLTNKIVTELGESFRAHAAEIIAASKPVLEREARVARKKDKRPIGEQVAANAAEGKPPVPRLIKELVREQIANGVEKHTEIIRNVTKELEPHHPGITERQVSDIYSGYGKVSFPSKDALDIKMREVHRLRQLSSAIEDAMAKRAPLKSGPQRDKVTADIREMQKDLTRTMREQGIETASAEQQLKTTVDGIKTRLKNRIEDLNKQIAAGAKTPKKVGVELGAEAKAEIEGLKAEVEGLVKKLEAIEGPAPKKTLTDAQRIEMARKALEKSIADLDARVKAGDIMPRPKTSATPETMELQVMRDTRQQLRKELNRMKKLEASMRRDPVAEQLARDIKAINTRSRKLQERIDKGDFAPPVKTSPLMSKEKADALYKADQIKKEFLEGVFNMKLANRTRGEKILGNLQDTVNTSRAILTSLDLSAVFRQGGFLVLGNPVRAAKSIVPMLRAMRSEKEAFKIEQDIFARDNATSGLYERAGLDLTRSDAVSLTKMEEAYMSRWVNKIPKAVGGGLIRGSERAYRTFLNKLRADTFDGMVDSLRKGPEPTLVEAQAIANFVNTATGRGDLGKFNQAAVSLNTVFFAPKLVASRFQLLLGAPLFEYGSLKMRGTSRTQRLVATQYARFIIGASLVYAIGGMFQDEDDASLTFDPRSSDFGKLRFGNTRVDPLAGLSQATVLLGRLGTGEKIDTKGRKIDLRGDKAKYGTDDVFDVMSNFTRSKFSPLFGAVVNVAVGKNVVGEPSTFGSEAARLIVPMSYNDISKVLEEQGMPKGAVLSMLAILGMGVQTYDPTEKKKDK